MLFLLLLIGTSIISAQEVQKDGKIKIYCDVMCVQYNLFKADVNAVVDFGIADKAKNANGWIYDTSVNKKHSFASPMSVFAYIYVYAPYAFLVFLEARSVGSPGT